ncbi:MAG: PilN domain-containing protein [Gammaproteobacteria bacterium]|nr:PilN domain-containing protein [Gammaproteobacteria bacterium]
MTRQINLYNPDLRLVREFFCGRTLIVGAVAVFALSVVAYSLFTYQATMRGNAVRELDQQLKKVRDEGAAISAEIAARGKSVELERKLKQVEAAAAAREQIAASLAQGAGGPAGGFSEFMRAFARQTLPGVWLTGFSIAADGGEMTISGRALNPDLVPAYIARLNREPLLQGRRFAQFAVKQPAAEAVPVASERQAKAEGQRPAFHEFMLVSSAAGAAQRGGGAQ